jgi:hypothetical protein
MQAGGGLDLSRRRILKRALPPHLTHSYGKKGPVPRIGDPDQVGSGMRINVRPVREKGSSQTPGLIKPGGLRWFGKIAPRFEPPVKSPALRTSARAINDDRKNDRDRASKGGPEARVLVARPVLRGNRNATLAEHTNLIRRNPAQPQTDQSTGRKQFTNAFSSIAFLQPFQKSHNMLRGYALR